jgi:M3 family oligoendopeptidase
MTFNQYPYQRPDIKAFSQAYTQLLQAFDQADSPEAQAALFIEINTLRSDYDSNRTVARIRHTVDTSDATYEAENTFFDQVGPDVEVLENQFYQALCRTPHRQALEAQFGAHFFNLATLQLKTFNDSILELMREENRLKSEYVKLLAQAKLEIDGQTYNLSSITPLEVSPDRDLRRRASAVKWDFFGQHAETIADFYDKLVQTRTQIAHKLGYENFIQLGYDRMNRTDYSAAQVKVFREGVKQYIVPLCSKIRAKQAKRLGLTQLKHYDLGFKFNSGNAEPAGSPEWIIEQAAQMYRELSPETDAFFQRMTSEGLMDLLSKPNKAPGGYCTFMGQFEAPFIFSNFNGTSDDIDVLTHEAGHAFQVFAGKYKLIPEYTFPTYEACEIHSMSMEFITFPWMELFFQQDADKYRYNHLSEALLFMPYGCAVDEFQHEMYAQPDLSPAQRNEVWKRIQSAYLPDWDFSDSELLQQGVFWYKQSHIFKVPFYYIDYVLAQSCALQFWKKSQQNHQAAWAEYLQLCEAGGSMSFLPLVKLANLRSPFEPDLLADVAQFVSEWLEKVDDSQF